MYLRAICDYLQNNCIDLLTLVEFTYNNTIHLDDKTDALFHLNQLYTTRRSRQPITYVFGIKIALLERENWENWDMRRVLGSKRLSVSIY